MPGTLGGFCQIVLILARCVVGSVPDPGFGAFLSPGSGIRDEQKTRIIFPRPLKQFFGLLKFFDANLGSGMEKIRIRDPGWKKFGSRIRDKHPGSATLVVCAVSVPVVYYVYRTVFIRHC